MWWRTTRKSCCSWPLCVSVPCAVMTDDYSKQYVKLSDYPSAGLDGCPKDPSVVAKFKWEMTLMWKLQEHCSYYLAHQCQSNRKFKIEHMWEEINKFPCRIIISRRGTRGTTSFSGRWWWVEIRVSGRKWFRIRRTMKGSLEIVIMNIVKGLYGTDVLENKTDLSYWRFFSPPPVLFPPFSWFKNNLIRELHRGVSVAVALAVLLALQFPVDYQKC